MVHGIHANDRGRAVRGEPDASEFGRMIQVFAQDAHRIFGSPDSRPDELIELHGRVFDLLCEAPAAGSSGIRQWLLSVRKEIGDRLESWSMEELESWVV